jgi:hypothetical protein
MGLEYACFLGLRLRLRLRLRQVKKCPLHFARRTARSEALFCFVDFFSSNKKQNKKSTELKQKNCFISH